MHPMNQPMNQTTNQTNTSRQALQIGCLDMLMSDLDLQDYSSLTLRCVLKVYRSSLIRRFEHKSPTRAEYDRMIETVSLADELLTQLQGEPEMKSWFYGIPTVDNVMHSAANLLCRIRVDLLMTIGAIQA